MITIGFEDFALPVLTLVVRNKKAIPIGTTFHVHRIPLPNRHLCLYEPPRPLESIEGEIKHLEKEIMEMLREVTA